MARLIDLDELVGADIEVKLAGKTYLLPPDCPVELWLAITDPAIDGDNREQTMYLHGKILELFQIRQPALKALPIGMAQLVNIVSLAYAAQDPEPQETDATARPTTRRTRGGTSNKPGSKPAAKRTPSK